MACTLHALVQTLAQSLATKRQKRNEEEKNMMGCVQFVEETEEYELLEERFVTTSSSCCEVKPNLATDARCYSHE